MLYTRTVYKHMASECFRASSASTKVTLGLLAKSENWGCAAGLDPWRRNGRSLALNVSAHMIPYFPNMVRHSDSRFPFPSPHHPPKYCVVFANNLPWQAT